MSSVLVLVLFQCSVKSSTQAVVVAQALGHQLSLPTQNATILKNDTKIGCRNHECKVAFSPSVIWAMPQMEKVKQISEQPAVASTVAARTSFGT